MHSGFMTSHLFPFHIKSFSTLQCKLPTDQHRNRSARKLDDHRGYSAHHEANEASNQHRVIKVPCMTPVLYFLRKQGKQSPCTKCEPVKKSPMISYQVQKCPPCLQVGLQKVPPGGLQVSARPSQVSMGLIGIFFPSDLPLP